VIYVLEAKEAMLEETKESYRFFFSKALLGKFHMDHQKGEAFNAGFI
jgi:hypothetical protein